MDESLQKQQEWCDQRWLKFLSAKREQFSNLQLNLDFLKKVELLKPGSKALEIGCGIGGLVSELSSQGYDVTGTDISREAIAYGLKKYGDIKLEVQPAEALSYEDESFDFVLSFDLFEHIAQIDRHVSEVYRVLRPGGYYLLQTPNKYSNVTFQILWKKTLKGHRRSHPSLHTPRQLRRRLAKHGFEVQFVKMNPINEFTIRKLQRLGLIGDIIKHINFRRLPLILQTNLYVIAQKVRN
jgi:ubiquinone/menaquinone biosynthesis C-methylase UbiE